MQTALITLFFPEFLLTPLREGRHAVFQQAGRECAYFYSRPCGRGDLPRLRDHLCSGCISTHAPAGGATTSDFASVERKLISTHAPAGGATGLLIAAARLAEFLLTPLREGRPHALECLFRRALFLLTPLREGRQIGRERNTLYV